MTNPALHTRTQLYLAAPQPCPYLPGRMERKVFTLLSGANAEAMNDALTLAGFRRSQDIAYRPMCQNCDACVSIRVIAAAFTPSRSLRRIASRNGDLSRRILPARATEEQFVIMRRYLDARHGDGGMAAMTALDYAAMIEDSPVATHVVEYRDEGGRLVAAALTDTLGDGLSMVYSFFDPDIGSRSLGTFMVLDHIAQARENGLPHVYLGYLIAQCGKMAYKLRFRPAETLTHGGWKALA
jgi:arginyl-tRNA--protein-N-Asp/Glu arginylyltransferase